MEWTHPDRMTWNLAAGGTPVRRVTRLDWYQGDDPDCFRVYGIEGDVDDRTTYREHHTLQAAKDDAERSLRS